MSRQICSHTPSALNAGAKRSEAERSDVSYDHASMLLLGEGIEATEPYNKYANLFKNISPMINLINPFGRHFCRPCDRRHIVAQTAGDEMSLTLIKLATDMSPFLVPRCPLGPLIFHSC